MKKKLGIVCKSPEHFQELKERYKEYFETFDVSPIYLNYEESINGMETDRVITEELVELENSRYFK